MCCVCAGTCNHVGNHTFCQAHGGSPAPAFGSYSYMTPVTSTWGPYCVTCGHPADRHGRTFCTVMAGGTTKRLCDCDGYNDGGNEEPLPAADPDCWCVECKASLRARWIERMPFVGMALCPDCGDKRCPRAGSHEAPCDSPANVAGETP